MTPSIVRLALPRSVAASPSFQTAELPIVVDNATHQACWNLYPGTLCTPFRWRDVRSARSRVAWVRLSLVPRMLAVETRSVLGSATRQIEQASSLASAHPGSCASCRRPYSGGFV